MAEISTSVSQIPIVRYLEDRGLHQIHVGKVRHTFALAEHPDLLLVVTSGRLSIFDFVLNTLVPDKGQVLTAYTVAWSVIGPLQDFADDLVAYGSGIDEYLSENLRGNAVLQSCALVVKKLDMLDKECIVRGYLTGSGWKDYQRTGSVGGHALSKDLHDGSKLEPAIFTPSTKAETGHDLNITAEEVRAQYGTEPEDLSLTYYENARAWALYKGIAIADTKFELGRDERGILTIGDERLTPDSSRYWLLRDLKEANKQRKSPQGFDKEPVRVWGKTVETPFMDEEGCVITGLHKLDPENPDHLKFVSGLEVPEQIIQDTTTRYRAITEMMWGMSLEDLQRDVMGIVV